MQYEPEIHMPLDPQISEEFRVLMARRNINVAKLIRMTGLNRRTISKILDAEQNADVRLSTLEAISRALGCTLELAIEDHSKTAGQPE